MATAAPAETGDGQSAAPALSEIESFAVEQGWRPEAEYTGPAEKWKPARDWLAAEKTINRDLKSTVKGLKDTVDRLASAATRTTERALKAQAEEINARFAAAVENKDAKGAADAAAEMNELRVEAAPAVTPKDTEAKFARENSWYGSDRKMTAFAQMFAQELAGKKVPLEEQLPLIAEEVRKEFPEKFEGEQRTGKTPPSVNAPSRNVSVKREKSFSDLPPAAQKAANDYAKLFKDKHGVDPEKSRADYAKDYWANTEA